MHPGKIIFKNALKRKSIQKHHKLMQTESNINLGKGKKVSNMKSDNALSFQLSLCS